MRISGRQTVHLLLLTVAVLVVFGNSLLNGFVWDDSIYTAGNRVYREFDLGRMFFSLANGVEYLPLRDLTYALDYAIWGERAAGFHSTNLFLYLANVIVVYYLTAQIARLMDAHERHDDAGVGLVSLLTALFFAVHPIHSEAVAWVTGRNVLLSGLFFFLSCHLYLKFLRGTDGVRAGYYIGALLAFLCALLSKATTITLPLVLAFFAAFGPGSRRWKNLSLLSPFLVLSLIFFFVFREVALQTKVIDGRFLSLASPGVMAKAATALQIPFFYLKKLAIPVGFSAEYGAEFAKSPADPLVLTALAALVAILVAAVAARAKYPALLIGVAWFLLTLIPVLNFFSTNPVVADRYAYLPSFGFFFIIATGLAGLLQRERRTSALLWGAILVACWSAVAFARNAAWKSDKTLWEETVKSSPKEAKAYINLGDIYFREGDHDRAFSLFAKAREVGTPNDYYDLYQGYLFAAKGDPSKAVDAFKKALFRNDDFIDALYALGAAYEKSGAFELAVEYYNKTLVSMEQDRKGYRESARQGLQRLLKMFAPQLDAMRKRVADNPRDLKARGELALRLDTLGLYDEALSNYLGMERLGVKDWRLYYNTANVYKKLKSYRDAARYYEMSLTLNPAYADALNNLGLVYREMKEYKRAIAAFEQAIAGNGLFAYAPFNLATTYLQMGDKDNALRYFRYTQGKFPEFNDKVAPYLKELEMTASARR